MAENTQEVVMTAEDENHIIAERRAKLAKWREEGRAYPNDFVRKDLFGDIRTKYENATAEELEALQPEVAVSGRMMLKRIMGKASFATVRDGSGQMQYFMTPSEMGDEAYAAFKTMDHLRNISAAFFLIFISVFSLNSINLFVKSPT